MNRIALLAAALLLAAFPAQALTPSSTCVAALKAANAKHRAAMVPDDCWRMGLLSLGISRVAAEGVMGPPDAFRQTGASYRRQKFGLVEAFYVYPRNLKSWLRLVPQPLERFQPITLHLLYWREKLVGIAVSHDARTDSAPCTAKTGGRVFLRGGADYPFNFHGIGLGAKMEAVTARFGRFATINASRDFASYWPVPLSFGGEGQVEEIAFATGMAFVGISGMPRFQVRRDPATCLVTGYTVSAPP